MVGVVELLLLWVAAKAPPAPAPAIKAIIQYFLELLASTGAALVCVIMALAVSPL